VIEYAIPFISVVLGALAGISAVLLGEIWKAVLDFQVAARIVRGELFRTQAMLRVVSDDPEKASTNFVDQNWKAAASALAFLMEEREWRILALHYTILDNLRYEITNGDAINVDLLEALLNDMEISIDILSRIVKRGRIAMLLDALMGKTRAVILPD
jgi:hypothetical protein